MRISEILEDKNSPPQEQRTSMRISEVLGDQKPQTIYLKDINANVSIPSNYTEQQKQDAIAEEYAKHPAAKIPNEGKDPFYERVSSRFIGGLWDATANFWKITPIGRLFPEYFIKPAEEQAKNWRDLAGEPKGIWEEGGLDFAEGMGRIAPDIYSANAIGGLINTQLIEYGAKKFIPEAFATGTAAMRWMRSFWEGKGPIDQIYEAGKGLAEGTLYSKIGSKEGNVPETFKQALTRIGKTIPQMGGAGMTFAASSALEQGRLPTKKELLKGGADGMATALVFAMLPTMNVLTSFDSQSEYFAHLKNIEDRVNKNDFDGTKKAINDLIGDRKIDQDVRTEADNMINKEMITFPESGETVFITPREKGHTPEGLYEKTREFLKQEYENIQKGKEIFEQFRVDVLNASEADMVRFKLKVEELGLNKEDAEAIYHFNENGKEPLTNQQRKIWDEHIKPLKEEHDALREVYRKYKIPVADEPTVRIAKTPNVGFYERIREGGRAFIGGLLRRTGDFMKRRKMKSLIDISDESNRKVISISDDRNVYSWLNKKSTFMGKFETEKMEDIFEKETRNVRKRIASAQEKLSELNKVKIKQPISGSRGEKLFEKIHDTQSDLEAKRAFADELYGWGKGLRETLGDLRKAIDGREREIGRDLTKLNSLMDELDILSSIKSAEELTNLQKLKTALNQKLVDLDNEYQEIVHNFNPYQMNDKVFVDNSGKKWRVGDATTREIENHTDVEYNKHIQVNYLERIAEMRKVSRAIKWVEMFKSHPDFKKISVKVGVGEIPKTKSGNQWKKTDLYQMKDYYFEPHVADALDFINEKIRRGKDPFQAFTTVNSVLRNAIFFNPLIHVPNIANHWAVNRGVAKWVIPSQYSKGWNAAMKAWDAVRGLNKDYLEAMDAGANLLYHGTKLKGLHDIIIEKMGWELSKNKTLLKNLSKDFGYANPANLVKGLYNLSSRLTWFVNDLATMQAVYEEMANGKTLESAIEHVGKHIPNYVVPQKIMNSKAMGFIMRNPNLTMFGAYHYGAFKSYGEMIKSAIAPVDKKDRADALDKMLALGIVTYFVYPALDKVVQGFLGDERYHLRRAGASTFFDNVEKFSKGQIGFENVLPTIFTPTVGAKAFIELFFNKKLFTGEQLIHEGTAGEDLFRYTMENIAPLAGAQRMAEGKIEWYDYLLGMASVSKTDPNVGKMYRMSSEKKNMQKHLNKLAKTDEDEAIERAKEFNISQVKQLVKIAKEAGIEGIPDRTVLDRYLVNIGRSEEELDMKNIESFFKKPSRRRTIYRGINADEVRERLEEMQ